MVKVQHNSFIAFQRPRTLVLFWLVIVLMSAPSVGLCSVNTYLSRSPTRMCPFFLTVKHLRFNLFVLPKSLHECTLMTSHYVIKLHWIWGSYCKLLSICCESHEGWTDLELYMWWMFLHCNVDPWSVTSYISAGMNLSTFDASLIVVYLIIVALTAILLLLSIAKKHGSVVTGMVFMSEPSVGLLTHHFPLLITYYDVTILLCYRRSFLSYLTHSEAVFGAQRPVSCSYCKSSHCWWYL